jgi:Skp family chaperone for outer membrane proteins
MKVFHVIAAVAVIGAFAILVQTQTRPVTPASSPQSKPAAGPANVAVIDSAVFSDDKNGIARVMSAMKQINTKFLPLRTEIRGMNDRLKAMRADIQKKQGAQDARMTAQQVEEADRLEVQIKRKAEDAQSSFQKESLAALEPLQQDIHKALTAYAQAKGISILIDVNRVPVVYSAANVDITMDFIAEYNRTHPATGAPARP